MIKIEIPGKKTMRLKHLVLDYNGTLAVDGKLLPNVAEKLKILAEKVEVHLVTADTFGLAERSLQGLPCRLVLVPPTNQQDSFKKNYIKELGFKYTACIGNGKNDLMMMKKSALAIGVIEEEGAFFKTLCHADIVCRSIVDALGLLIEPRRLLATLRNR